ncbi:MAG: nucleotidyltransferase [Mycobacterium sp.]
MELWTDAQAAQHWGVTRSRARTILSSRKIRRIAGYPAAEVRAVTRRQGARTDLATSDAETAPTLTDIAEAATATDEPIRLRYFFEFMRAADAAGPAALRLIDDEPPPTGDTHFDALLAAAAEHVAAQHSQPGPLWTVTIDRFLPAGWWISDLPSVRAFALVGTPASFRRRGIYLDRHDLETDETFMPTPVFDEPDLIRAFNVLATKLHAKNVVGTVHVVGGAAMGLSFHSRVTTRDIDALFSPDGPMLAAIREVADELGWPRTWLNNQASRYVARNPGEGTRVFDHPNLQVSTTPAEHLLAMKTHASRGTRDRGDIELLIEHLGITTCDEVWALTERYFPGIPIPDRARLLIEDLLGITG